MQNTSQNFREIGYIANGSNKSLFLILNQIEELATAEPKT